VGDDAFCGGGCTCDPGNVKPIDEGGFCYDPKVDYSGCCLCMGGGMTGGGMPLLVEEPLEGEGMGGEIFEPSEPAFGLPCNVGDDAFCGGGCTCDPGNVKPKDEGGICYNPKIDYDGCCLCGMPLPVERPPGGEGTGGEMGGDVVIGLEPDEPAKETIASKACTITSDERERVDCGDGEFCMLDTGECDTRILTHKGTCMAVPEACITLVSPVCGCDQVTYSNECEAHAKGVSVSRDGPCVIEPIVPPGASYCTYSPDATCYRSGHPACCAEPGTCPEARPPCEIEETATEAVETANTTSTVMPLMGKSYCTYAPDEECYESGWPACCREETSCPEERPECEVDATATGSTVAATDPKGTTTTSTGSTVAAADPNATSATTTGSTLVAADTKATTATITWSTVAAADPKATNTTTTGSTVAAADPKATNATTMGITVAAADTKATTAAPPDGGGDDVDEFMEPDSSAGVPALPISVAAGACLLMLVP